MIITVVSFKRKFIRTFVIRGQRKIRSFVAILYIEHNKSVNAAIDTLLGLKLD